MHSSQRDESIWQANLKQLKAVLQKYFKLICQGRARFLPTFGKYFKNSQLLPGQCQIPSASNLQKDRLKLFNALHYRSLRIAGKNWAKVTWLHRMSKAGQDTCQWVSSWGPSSVIKPLKCSLNSCNIPTSREDILFEQSSMSWLTSELDDNRWDTGQESWWMIWNVTGTDDHGIWIILKKIQTVKDINYLPIYCKPDCIFKLYSVIFFGNFLFDILFVLHQALKKAYHCKWYRLS